MAGMPSLSIKAGFSGIALVLFHLFDEETAGQSIEMDNKRGGGYRCDLFQLMVFNLLQSTLPLSDVVSGIWSYNKVYRPRGLSETRFSEA